LPAVQPEQRARHRPQRRDCGEDGQERGQISGRIAEPTECRPRAWGRTGERIAVRRLCANAVILLLGLALAPAPAQDVPLPPDPRPPPRQRPSDLIPPKNTDQEKPAALPPAISPPGLGKSLAAAPPEKKEISPARPPAFRVLGTFPTDSPAEKKP